MALFTELSLFSGVGGGLLATQHLLGWRTVCYVEWDKYAVEVLKARIKDGHLHDAPIWDDAFTFDGRPWAGLVDVVTAGFPCQPFSVAGKGLAEHDPRNGWPAVIRILREVRPRFAFLENVPGLLAKPYFGTILGELAEAGFDAEWDCISAEEMGANHKRERLWIVATNTESGARDISISAWRQEEELDSNGHGSAQQVADADSAIHKLGKHGEPSAAASIGGERGNHGGGEAEDVRGEWWAVEPNVGRVADGVAARVDRLRATGNGQVPAVAAEAWRRLGGLKR